MDLFFTSATGESYASFLSALRRRLQQTSRFLLLQQTPQKLNRDEVLAHANCAYASQTLSACCLLVGHPALLGTSSSPPRRRSGYETTSSRTQNEAVEGHSSQITPQIQR
jgi:hypothetical protein